jgi:hypothetical protein
MNTISVDDWIRRLPRLTPLYEFEHFDNQDWEVYGLNGLRTEMKRLISQEARAN